MVGILVIARYSDLTPGYKHLKNRTLLGLTVGLCDVQVHFHARQEHPGAVALQVGDPRVDAHVPLSAHQMIE